MRKWYPTRSSSVAYWYWTRRNGLRVVYHGSLGDMRSWYGTLPEFLRAIRDGREWAREF